MDSKNELQLLIEFYENNIKPYKFMYKLEHGIELSLEIKEEEVCHLIFGSLTKKNIPNSAFYKGKKGFEKIKNGEVTTVPFSLQDAYKSKSKAFLILDKVLIKPNAIMFNQKIVKKRNGNSTDIAANFLFYKEKNNIVAHLFIEKIKNSREERFIAKSCFHNNDENYIKDQIVLKVNESWQDKIGE